MFIKRIFITAIAFIFLAGACSTPFFLLYVIYEIFK